MFQSQYRRNPDRLMSYWFHWSLSIIEEACQTGILFMLQELMLCIWPFRLLSGSFNPLQPIKCLPQLLKFVVCQLLEIYWIRTDSISSRETSLIILCWWISNISQFSFPSVYFNLNSLSFDLLVIFERSPVKLPQLNNDQNQIKTVESKNKTAKNDS